MKISHSNHARRHERGSATLIVFILLSIMAILVVANVRSAVRLQREIRQLETKQIQRLQAPAPTQAKGNATRP